MPEDDRSYHHGDLPAALLDAVDAVVREQGVAAVTLREVARRAGVSHAAPSHHYGDKAGLLTAYAAQGFETLRDQLSDAGQDAVGRGEPALLAIGMAYVRFAIGDSGRFTVMFRPEAVRSEQQAYREACDGAFGVLVEAVRALRPELAPSDPELLHAATGAWSIVHGFATLWLDGNLAAEITSAEPADAAAQALAAFGATLFVAAGVPLPQ